MCHPSRQSGFTLVELSVVLVILALLTGGILGGQSLIKAAQLRSVASEAESYRTAAFSFLAQYDALPGDMKNATDYWGDAGHCGSVYNSNSPVSPLVNGTCNGNADGIVALNGLTLTGHEEFLFWHHLSLSGRIAGQFTGVRGSSGGSHHINKDNGNAPASKFSGGGWGMTHSTNLGLGGLYVRSNYPFVDLGNFFLIGSDMVFTYPNGKLLTPEEAWSLDKKYDDGKPLTGKILAIRWLTDCTTASGTNANRDFAADYAVSKSTVECSLAFLQDF